MKNFLVIVLMFVGANAVLGQSRLLEKAMSAMGPAEIEFYADAAMTEKIDRIVDGQNEFYLKVPVKSKLAMECGNYTDTRVKMNYNNERGGVYEEVIEHGIKVSKVSKENNGYLTYSVDLHDPVKADLWVYYLQEAEAKTYDLIFEVGGGRNQITRLGEGTLTLDLTGGKDKFMAYQMGLKADFTFDNTDAFVDNELKQVIKNHYANLKGITIYGFAWGERVPYTEDMTNYRRHSAGVTYQNKEGKCYHAGLSVFTSTPYPRSDYKFDGESAYLNNSEQVPCDRIIN